MFSKLKELDIFTPLTDVEVFGGVVLCRAFEELIAIDYQSLDVVWEKTVLGEHKIWFDYIYKVNDDLALVFSCNPNNRSFYIECFSPDGQKIWELTSPSAPQSKQCITHIDNDVFFTGHDPKTYDATLYKLNIQTGELQHQPFEDPSDYVLTAYQSALLHIGTDDILKLEEKQPTKRVAHDPHIEFATRKDDSLFYIRWSEEEQQTGLFQIDLNHDDMINHKGNVVLDASDRSYMTPFFYDQEHLIIFNGKHKGVSCYSLPKQSEIWRDGDGKWSCFVAVRIHNLLVLRTENTDSDATILAYDVMGNSKGAITTDVYPDEIHAVKDYLFVSSMDGLEVLTPNLISS